MNRFKVGQKVVAMFKMTTFYTEDKPLEINAEAGDIGVIEQVDPWGEGDIDSYHVRFGNRPSTDCSALEINPLN